ncbi:MAG: hypothetical protein ACT4O9_10495, partial [Blastocatellia bacterium]
MSLSKTNSTSSILQFIAVCAVLICATGNTLTQKSSGGLTFTASFADKDLLPRDRIVLRASSGTTLGAIGIVLNDTDITELFSIEGDELIYLPTAFPLPVGENRLSVYSRNANGVWRLEKEFVLKVSNVVEPSPTRTKTKFEFTPTLSLNFKGESNINYFPATARPERLAFADTAMQGGLQLKVTRAGWSFGGQFDLAGSSRRNEALRFGELGDRAPSIDLSSYKIEATKGRFKAELGHVSFGSQRHLINSFSSRGLSVTVPAGKQNEIIFSAMNGTSIFGFDNFA